MHPLNPKNNFDHIRLFLALAVFLHHLTVLDTFAFFKHFVNPNVAVHSFFIVSGFLIFMSYERSSTVKSYFIKRFKRIAPGYITVIVLAFLLLSFLSTLPLKSYFSSLESWQYLFINLSTLGFAHGSLPGVFTENPITAVNGPLWTIKVEVMFYLSIPLIALLYPKLGKTKTLIAIFLLSVLYFYSMETLYSQTHNPLYGILIHQLPGQMMFFSAGALLYYHHDLFLKYKHQIFILAVIIYLVTKEVSVYPLYALSLSVMVVYLATGIRYLGHIAKYGDLSYGIYIWHFPLIQTFIALHFFDTNPWLAFLALTGLVLFISWLSWHLVEKPFLSKKSH